VPQQSGALLFLDPPYLSSRGLEQQRSQRTRDRLDQGGLPPSSWEYSCGSNWGLPEHQRLRAHLGSYERWVLCHADCPEIRELYTGFVTLRYEMMGLQKVAGKRRWELLVLSPWVASILDTSQLPAGLELTSAPGVATPTAPPQELQTPLAHSKKRQGAQEYPGSSTKKCKTAATSTKALTSAPGVATPVACPQELGTPSAHSKEQMTQEDSGSSTEKCKTAATSLPQSLKSPGSDSVLNERYIGKVEKILAHGNAMVSCSQLLASYGRGAFIFRSTLVACGAQENDQIRFSIQLNRSGRPQVAHETCSLITSDS